VREQTRKTVVWVLIGGCLALFGAGFMAGLGRSNHIPELAAVDRVPLIDETVNGQHRLHHPTLGFSFRLPAGFAASQQIVDQVKKTSTDQRFHYYGFVDDPLTAVVEVAMMNEDVPNREALVKGLADFEQSFDSKGNGRYEDGVTWTDQLRDAHFSGVLDGLHFRVRMIPITPKDHPPAMVALVVISRDENVLADTLASFGP
jgi:hypothetical protein